MFSGIVEEVGVVTALTRPAADAARMIIGARTVLAGTEVGASIAVDGVCQTVVAIDGRTLTIDSVGATLRKTTLGSFAPGRRVNLERPLAYGNRVDGHLVQGHVNDTGTVTRWEKLGAARWLEIRLPRPLLPYVVLEGSIAIDGVSLTVAGLEDDRAGFSIIPHTARATALTDRRVGDPVNVEVDMIAKYVERLAGPHAAGAAGGTANPAADADEPAPMAGVDEAAEAIARGEMVLMIDDVDRENEGDLVAAAALVTPRIATCMLRRASGLLCAAITAERAEQLDLPPMAQVNTALHGTRFTVSIDAVRGTTTGESAHDRAATLRALADPQASPADFARPGHLFPLVADPGGVAARAGHTEAAVELAARAGLPAAAAICPVLDDDGGMARRAGLSGLARRLKVPMLHVAQLAS
jgi:3,4-dihydroxy 2-butanone 4-phosphate synthase/3,4-dihydroxy 2-butanone 4-phosphate synthase/GTP cyclohydrolase II